MSELQLIQKDIREIKSMLRQVTKVRSWVNGQQLTQLTNWSTPTKLRTARDTGLVKWKKEKGKSIVYDLDSINPLFLKKDA